MVDNSQNISLVQNSVFYTGHTHITINSKKKLHQNKLSEKFQCIQYSPTKIHPPLLYTVVPPKVTPLIYSSHTKSHPSYIQQTHQKPTLLYTVVTPKATPLIYSSHTKNHPSYIQQSHQKPPLLYTVVPPKATLLYTVVPPKADFLSVVGETFFNDYLRVDTKRFPISVK